MSKFRDLQHRTWSYFRKIVNDKDVKINVSSKFSDETSDVLYDSNEDQDKQENENRQKRKILNSYLIDHNLLKPLPIYINKYIIFLMVLIIWIILMNNNNVKIKYFLFGCIITFSLYNFIIFLLYVSTYDYIEYRKKLLEYFENELKQISKIAKVDHRKFDSASSKRKGWVYLMEYYDKNNFKNSDLVLAYAILQKTVLILYIIDDKFILKPKQNVESFNNCLKKMKSTQKIAIDMSDVIVELKPNDLPLSRYWNRKFPIKLSQRDPFCILDVEAPVSSFIDITTNQNEPYLIPNYHRQNSIHINENELYLFGIGGREKERWYYKLMQNSESCKPNSGIGLTKFVEKSGRSSFDTYIEDILKKGRWVEEKLTYSTPSKSQSTSYEINRTDMLMASSMFSLNVLLSRLFWDLWREQKWNDKYIAKIQRTLDRLALPQFLKYLKADNLNIGDTLPLIFSAEQPNLDDDGGIWINCPIFYEGEISLDINTQIHHDLYAVLVEKERTDNPPTIDQNTNTASPDISKYLIDSSHSIDSHSHNLTHANSTLVEHTNETLSATSSPRISLTHNDDSGVKIITDNEQRKNIKSKQNNVSKYIHENKEAIKSKAIDYAKKICKSAANHIENSTITLHVTLTLIKGTLSIYLPPPPSNRIWLGFRTMPVVVLNVRSRIGNFKTTKFPILTQWIEKKLKELIKDDIVIPSMIDIFLPFLSSGIPDLQTNNLV